MEDHLAELLCRTGRKLREREFIAASEGNLSVRLQDGHILCSPTGIDKGDMTPADLCVVDAQGRQVDGTRRPSSEIRLHLELYASSNETHGVVHCHPPHATAFAITGLPLPQGILAEVETFLGEIANVPYATPGTTTLAELIRPFAETSCCAILQNHGAVSWGPDLTWALSSMEILDAYCRALILAQQVGALQPLPSGEAETLRALGRQAMERN